MGHFAGPGASLLLLALCLSPAAFAESVASSLVPEYVETQITELTAPADGTLIFPTRKLLQGCSDTLSWCSQWSQYCGDQWVYNGKKVGTELCPKTCNKCSGGGGSCSDTLSWCGQWSQYCGDQWVYNGKKVGSELCPKTCNKCGGSSGGGGSGGGGGGSGDWRGEMLSLVNRHRSNNGKGSMCMNSKLNDAAQRHSEDQARTKSLSHTGSDGSSMATRVNRVGYRWNGIAENVAQNWGTSSSATFDQWKNSPGHNTNMLGGYAHAGFGMARADNGAYYWTQVFANSGSEGCS